jgi:hypothetical protein
MGPKRSTTASTAAAPAPVPKKTKKTAAAAAEGDEFVARREDVKDFDKVIAQEIQRESEIQKSEELNEKYKLGGLDALCGLKAGKAFNWLYRLDTKASFDDELYTNARDWWERADAIQQCNNTIGEKNMADECYICGLKLNEDTGAKKTPECEHILPVFQGALFLNLYRSEYKNIMTKVQRRETLSPKERELYDTFMLEYKWAHRCCNQIKSNISFLTFDPKREEFKLDFTSSSVILKGIFEAKMSKKEGKGSETRAYCNAISKILKANYKNDVNKFIKERSDIIFHRNIKPICDRLHRQMGNKMARKGVFYLGLLANLITAADSNKISAAQAAARGEELNRPPPMESIEKAQIYSDLTSNIASMFNGPKWGIRGINKDEKNAVLRRLISSTDQESWLLDSKLLVDSNKIAKLMIESFVDGSILRTTSSSSITYKSLYRDLFCIFAYPSHFNKEILVHSDSGARQISHKDSAKFANYGMRAVLLSEISSRFSSLLLLYHDKTDPLYLGISAVHIKIKSLLKETILALKLSKNNTKVLCVVMRVCEFFDTAAKTEFETILTSESLYTSVNAELLLVNENYLADANIISGRIEYYKFYAESKALVDIESDEIIKENIDILEVNAIDILTGMNQSKEIFTSSVESESQDDLAAEFIKTEQDCTDVFIEQIESPIKAELLSLSRSRSRSRSESLSPATTAETTSTSSSAAQRVYTEQELLYKTHSELSKIAKSFGIRQTQTYKSLVKQIANTQRRKYTQRYLEEHTTLSQGGRKTRRNRK